MTTLEDLYIYYCRHCSCKPNTHFCAQMREAYDAAGQERVCPTIDVSSNYLGPKGIEPVLELARTTYSVKVLDLRNNMLEEPQVERVARALIKHPGITKLNLSFNALHDGCIPHLAHLLQTNRNIVYVSLDGNKDLSPAALNSVEDLANDNRLFQQDEAAAAGAHDDEDDEEYEEGEGEQLRRRRKKEKYVPFRSQIAGVLTKETSGGHLHFATWRKNPQYVVYVNRETQVTITLKVQDPTPTRQLGFVVLRGDGLLRVVDVKAEDILAESSFDDSCTRAVLTLPATDRAKTMRPVIVMPFTFNPGKTAEYTLTAEIPPEDDGIATIESLDSNYNWHETEIHHRWDESNSGGSIAYPTWRDNDFLHVSYNGPVSKGMAELFIVLSKANDRDDQDDREIGFYIMSPTLKGRRRPVRIAPETILHTVPHSTETSVSLRFEIPCSAIDFYIVPTTLTPSTHGPYALCIFSTCPVNCAISHSLPNPHWSCRIVDGFWDEHKNGGSRSLNPTTWLHNPCYDLINDSGAPIDLHISLERTVEHPDVPFQQDPEQMRRVEVGMCLTATHGDLNTVATASWSAAKEAELVVSDLPPGAYYLLPMSKRAGYHDTFRLRVSTSSIVQLGPQIPLARRLREKQLQRYAAENEARRANAGKGVAVADVQKIRVFDEDYDAAGKMRDQIIDAYMQTGELHVDRDFPRSTSSLWMDPAKPPSDAPNVHTWKRIADVFHTSTVSSSVQTLIEDNDSLGAVIPETVEVGWLHSAFGVIATRHTLLASVVTGVYPEYGMYQFRFFKDGRWQTTTVDDYLPVDYLNDVCFSKGLDGGNVILPPLFEKAYAKVHRCYEALYDTRCCYCPSSSSSSSPSSSSSVNDAANKSMMPLLSEALMDLTGGLVHTHDFYTDVGREWAKKELWSKLKTCREASHVIAVALAKDATGSEDKKNVGVFQNRLYAIVDAREVEGYRLVKVRNYFGEHDKVWKGSWAASGNKWTPTIKKAIDYVPERHAFWASIEEIQYHFSHLFDVDLGLASAMAENGFSEAHNGGNLLDATWVYNPQYALAVHSHDKPAKVFIGIHQYDARTRLIRDADSVVQYPVDLGFCVIRTDDNARKLTNITTKELPTNSQIIGARDNYLELELAPSASPYKYVVMPFKLKTRSAINYYITARSESPVSLMLIENDMNVAVDGEWAGASAGGPRQCGTWRNNPQYLLYPSVSCQVTVVLRQRNELNSTMNRIGFTVLKARDIRRALWDTAEDVVLDVAHDNNHAVVGTVHIEGMKERQGMPYVIVPSTSHAGESTGFTLEVVSNKRVQLKPINPEYDWKMVVIGDRFSFADGTAGGSLAFSSWRSNPQYLVNFPTERSGTLLITLAKRNPSDENEIGLVVMRREEGLDVGKRRKIMQTPHSIMHLSPVTTGVSTEVSFTFQVRRESLVVMPFTSVPFTDLDYELSFYCTSDIQVTPAQEWVMHQAEGDWKLGISAGGCRERNRSWINNPFYCLSVTRPSKVFVLALQYPKGPEKPIVRQKNRKKVFMPPPIINESNKICFGCEICESDTANTRIVCSKHTFEGEVMVMQDLPANETTPYFIVPHSYEPEQEADFKLCVFSDEPFDLYHHEKARRFY